MIWMMRGSTVASSDTIEVMYVCCFFFFQAEDGIRDLTVTGVQTCALPICDKYHSSLIFADEPKWSAGTAKAIWTKQAPIAQSSVAEALEEGRKLRNAVGELDRKSVV